VEKFELLYNVLKELQDCGVLSKLVLVGSWCQDFYRMQYGNPKEIPAARTMDADVLIPKRIKLEKSVNIAAILERNDFTVEIAPTTGLYKFMHPELKMEFLTESGAKPQEQVHRFKQLGINAQELRFMSIPLEYNIPVRFRVLTINIPEPEAFAIHKLIISQRRLNAEKKMKDIEAAEGMFTFFKGKPKHIKRLHQIIGDMPRGWQKRIRQALDATGLELPE
jgi:hypothetical protein